MKRFVMMLMSVMFLFAVTSIKATPADTDIGKVVKTEMNQTVYSVETQAAVADFNFCQRTDMQVTSDVTQLYAFTDELICPQTEKSIYNIKQYILPANNKQYRCLNIAYDIGKNYSLNLPYFT